MILFRFNSVITYHEVVEGAALVNESSVTGESATAIKFGACPKIIYLTCAYLIL